jgi:predicted secreted protein
LEGLGQRQLLRPLVPIDNHDWRASMRHFLNFDAPTQTVSMKIPLLKLKQNKASRCMDMPG